MPQVTSEEVTDLARRLADEVASARFLDMIRQIRGVPIPERAGVGERAIAELKEEVTLPEGFRLALRAFETPREAVVAYDEGQGWVVSNGTVIMVTEAQRANAAEPEPLPEPEVIRSVIQEGVEEIGKFVTTPAFQGLLDELYALPEAERHGFVADVVLDEQERAKRGVEVPKRMFIQRSVFADGRPTLFCVSKVLPLAYPWHKVTITFDSR